MRPIIVSWIAAAMFFPWTASADCPPATAAAPEVDPSGRIHLPAISWQGDCVSMTLSPVADGFVIERLAPPEWRGGVFSRDLMKAVAAMLRVQRRLQPGADDTQLRIAIAAQVDADGGGRSTHVAQVLVAAQAFLGENEWEVFLSDPAKGILVLIDGFVAKQAAEERYPDSLYSGIGDAFRHGFWQALSARHTGEEYAHRFGDAHEADSPNSPLDAEMDFFNNEVGRGIGVSTWLVRDVDPNVENGIATGVFVYISDGVLVPTNQ